MKKIAYFIICIMSLALILMSACSDKSSSEACRYEVTMNLDKGNYDAVLAASCADAMQLGAAWFGKAGYDMQDVINRMIDANNTSSGPSASSDLNIFMTSLVSKVTDTTIVCLDNAVDAFTIVTQTTPTGSNANKDAQFYLSLAETMKSLSLIKVVMDANGDGLVSNCDINGNSTPDDVDAASCALKISSNLVTGSTYTCTGVASVTPAGPIDMTISTINTSGTPTYNQAQYYSGLIITLSTGTGTATATCPAEFRKLLYKDPSLNYFVATTLAGNNCKGTSIGGTSGDMGTWPCPLESNLDFVATVDTTMTLAIDTLSSSLTGTQAADIQQSIEEIKSANCCTEPGELTLKTTNPSACTCSSSELAAYMETI